jgi:hypothetical protein
MQTIDTPYLRASYNKRMFSFGDNRAPITVVLVGSCRIVPFLNYLRIHGTPMNLLCFNPIEMWNGPGCEVSDGVNTVMAGYRFGKVDYLICEHLQYCGVINTVRSSKDNIYDSLGCNPLSEIRLPNWEGMHIFDAETAGYDRAGYANLGHVEKVNHIRTETAKHKARFLSHCRECSFPQVESWTEENWLTTRLGWSSNHPTLTLIHKLFGLVAEQMKLSLSDQFNKNPIYTRDLYESTKMSLTPVDYEANLWQF